MFSSALQRYTLRNYDKMEKVKMISEGGMMVDELSFPEFETLIVFK